MCMPSGIEMCMSISICMFMLCCIIAFKIKVHAVYVLKIISECHFVFVLLCFALFFCPLMMIIDDSDDDEDMHSQL